MWPRHLLKSCLLLTVVCTFARGQSSPNYEVTVHVYDYDGTDPGELAEAEMFAAQILLDAGLHTQWANCRFSSEGMALDSCAAAAESATHLYVRLLPEQMARKLAPATKSLGRAMPTSSGTFPVDAYVFAGRVAALARQNNSPLPPLLGAAITHEVGHLLLASEAHTITGVMSPRWGWQERKDALRGFLKFSRRESEQLRAGVSQRLSVSTQRINSTGN